jgi:hypothetical protein
MNLQRLGSAILLAVMIFASVPGWARNSSVPNCREIWPRGQHRFTFEESYEDFSQKLKRTGCEKDWTVLVYMAADNDLFPYALWDLFEMEARFESDGTVAGSSLKTDLVVEVDGPAKDDRRRIHVFSGPVEYSHRTKTEFDRLDLSSVKSPLVERLREGSESEQKRLEQFLLWGAKNYPAKNYMVIVWGHGQGWKAYPVSRPAQSRTISKEDLSVDFPATASDKRFGGIAFRQSSGTWLDIPALRKALDSFTSEIGRPVDVYASDACLMQMLEVSYELNENARFIVGSTQVQNFLGLPYRRLMYELNSGRFNGQRSRNRHSVDESDEPLFLARMIPQLMRASFDPRRGSQGRSDREAQKFITSSALTSSELGRRLLPELARLSKAIRDYVAEEKLRALDLQFVLQNVPSLEGSAQDFGIFLGFLELQISEEQKKSSNPPSVAAERLKKQLVETKEALDLTVLAYAYGTSYGVDDAKMISFVPRAVSLWLPASSDEYRLRRAEFMKSQLYKDSQWNLWLDQVYGAQ